MRKMLIGCALLAGHGHWLAYAGLGAGYSNSSSAATGYGSNDDCNPRYEDCYRGERPRGYERPPLHAALHRRPCARARRNAWAFAALA